MLPSSATYKQIREKNKFTSIKADPLIDLAEAYGVKIFKVLAPRAFFRSTTGMEI